MTTKRRLGRGLDALLSRPADEFDEPGAAADLMHLSITDIDPNPFQPRQFIDPAELATLTESILQHGMLQPVVVRPLADRYQLVAGERRFRAAMEAGLADVPARVLELDDQQVFELGMVENLQREDLNAIEKAAAFREYLERFGATQEELSGRVGVDRSTISNLIRLLDLPEEIQQGVRTKQISQGHARALLALGDRDKQISAFQRTVAEALSVRSVEALVAEGRPPESRPRRPPAEKDSRLIDLEQQLRDRLGARVQIRVKAKERGQIVIDFETNGDFERILGLIHGGPAAG